MNRHAVWQGRVFSRIPHTRGDEPDIIQGVKLEFAVFPTRVGMNRVNN